MREDVMVGQTGLSFGRIKEILNESPEFHQHKGDSNLLSAEAVCISEGKGFLSQVFKVSAKFGNLKTYDFIVKIPFPAGLQQIIENEKPDGDQNVVDQIVVDGHNIECEFYENVRLLRNFPAPKVYASEKIIVGKQNGLLAMEDLSNHAEPLGFYRTANVNQLLNVASTLADLQFTAQQKEFAHWWKNNLRVTIHLEEIYTKYTDGAMPELKYIPSIYELLPKVPIVFDQNFGYYCLLQRPKQYNALTFCHGDMQPNNVLFKIDKNGESTDKLSGFIDYQLVFCGNPLFDLARFLTFGVDPDVRKKAEIQAYNVYYTKLRHLYTTNQKQIPFTYKQGFELFELALCQQVGFMITFLGIFHMAHRQSSREVAENFQILINRCKYCIQSGIEIIDKYDLNKLQLRAHL
ncbi:hypothetical protein M3Y97_00111700 [Aphelenchoides bicaudatus]|nr:hypothetical protein M3Y97_00111700 [Aphelenchoides bicaudatus]